MARLCFWRASPNALATFVEFAASIGHSLLHDILMSSMRLREGSTRPSGTRPCPCAKPPCAKPAARQGTTNNGRPFGVGARGGD
jgi:hypothetical protein